MGHYTLQATTAGNHRPGGSIFNDELVEGVTGLPGEGGILVLQAFIATAGRWQTLDDLRQALTELVWKRWRAHYKQIVAITDPVKFIEGQFGGIKMPDSLLNARAWYQAQYDNIVEVPVGQALASWQRSLAPKPPRNDPPNSPDAGRGHALLRAPPPVFACP